MDPLTQILVFSWSMMLVSGLSPLESNNTEAENRFNAEEDIVLRLYTKFNKNIDNPQFIINGNNKNLSRSHYDKFKSVKILVHGWRSSGVGDFNRLIMEAFLDHSDVNVFTVDWSTGAGGNYVTAKGHVSEVGDFIASVVDWLRERGSHSRDFHIIGHSLGAHAAGMAGRSVKSGKIQYVTALDPAKALWNDGNDHVNSNDASYVECIHTSNLGFWRPIAHNDFYPNGGESQPGCDGQPCSHYRSYMLYAASVGNERFLGIRCENVDEVEKDDCGGPERLHMGGMRSKPGMGIFHLKTKSEPPYYLEDF